jgi:hypothetical protein
LRRLKMLKTQIMIRLVLVVGLIIGVNLATTTPTTTPTPTPTLGWVLVEYTPDNHAHTVGHFATLTDCADAQFLDNPKRAARSCESRRDLLG